MTTVQPEEIGADDVTAVMDGPETIYIATVVNPTGGNQIMTAHRTSDGANAQIEEMARLWSTDRDALDADVLPLPLMP
ncbi:hypothetical protein [Mycolicibacterium sediminis]|uniref:Uncharacterized protein n=1 Tax=Mycolicibacterium sediminis TaxID=1286180 RepID=A0A7I7QRA7_9MYCO|nr:hypothetical protein [Mycolicibacterium sediminis]BBY28891.1 hypothetical protein MSEDJ_29870 [Mycolicibacterium sediminis]